MMNKSDEQEWSQYGTLWNTTGNVMTSGLNATVWHKLRSIAQVISEPVQGNTSYTVMVKVIQKNLMIYSVESIGKVQER